MKTFSDIRPQRKERVGKLLKRAGIKVKHNRHFLSLPAFQQRKIVVLNFWYQDQIKPRGGEVIVEWQPPEAPSHRMRLVHNAVKFARKRNLPVHIIVLDGNMRGKGSVVKRRCLDNALWRVTAYNDRTGKCVITRGATVENAVDDLSDAPEGNSFPDRARTVVQVIKRDNQVRAHVIKRASGKCEYCGAQGFPTKSGSYYVEAHHIIALCDEGRDTVDNVIGLCPLHHRQAHYGKDAESLESEFVRILKGLNRKNHAAIRTTKR